MGTIMQLPAMIAQTTMEAINAEEQAELSRQQHTDNYNLAVKQNDQVEADRLKQEMCADVSNGVPVGCEDPWGDQQKLVKQENEIYAAYDALDIEMDELL